MSRIDSNENCIRVHGRFGMDDFYCLLDHIHNLTTTRGHQEVVLDFLDCTDASPGPMLAVCAEVAKLRFTPIGFTLHLPRRNTTRNRFLKSNWAYLIDPESHHESAYQGHSLVPAISFASPEEQNAAVNRMINAVLSFVPGLARDDLAAVEWALGEITDNVLTHAQSEAGGLVQLTSSRTKRTVEFVVADSGLGVPATLRQGHPEMTSDIEALDKAIREGVTKDPRLGQGNGLYGTVEIVKVGNGYMNIRSGSSNFDFDYRKGGLHHFSKSPTPFQGTLVMATMDCSQSGLLAEALKFDGTTHQPVDYIERFEVEDGDNFVFFLRDESSSFLTRVAGGPVRTKLENLHNMDSNKRIVVDFSDVPLISSSFADEVFAKLFLRIGKVQFGRALELQGMTDTVHSLIKRAISQRMGQGVE